MTKRLKEHDRFLLTCDFCNWKNFQQAIPGHFVNPPPKSCTLSASRIIFLRPCFPTASGLRGCLPSWLRCSSKRHSPGRTAATAWVVALLLCGSRWAGFQNRKGLTQITHMRGVLILYPIPPVSTTPEYLFWRLSHTRSCLRRVLLICTFLSVESLSYLPPDFPFKNAKFCFQHGENWLRLIPLQL